VTTNPRAAFFDDIAERWDGWEDLPGLALRLGRGLAEFGVAPGETVLDVGCGTGNLVRALLERLSPSGRVIAVDIAPRMIEVARRKVTDARVEWRNEEARALGLPDGSVDRVICCAVWPHFDGAAAVAREMRRVLRPGGSLHVWHPVPRARVNEIHASAGEPVRHDMLAPGAETAAVLEAAGLRVTAVVDDGERYLVTAVRPAP